MLLVPQNFLRQISCWLTPSLFVWEHRFLFLKNTFPKFWIFNWCFYLLFYLWAQWVSISPSWFLACKGLLKKSILTTSFYVTRLSNLILPFLKKKKNIKKNTLFMCMGVLPALISIHHVYILPVDTKKGLCIHCNWSYRQWWAVSCRWLGLEPRFSGRTACASSHWAISPALILAFDLPLELVWGSVCVPYFWISICFLRYKRFGQYFFNLSDHFPLFVTLVLCSFSLIFFFYPSVWPD